MTAKHDRRHISLRDDAYRKLKAAADARGVSMAKLVEEIAATLPVKGEAAP